MSIPNPSQLQAAGAVILIKQGTDPADPQVFWARRRRNLAFMAGFHAFPGGKRDKPDAQTVVAGDESELQNTMIACAARELFEETGVLVARGMGALTVGQRASLHDDVASQRLTFAQMLAHYGLTLHASDFKFAGRWVTPAFSPKRFDTWFFLAECPERQNPTTEFCDELEAGEWISARAAVEAWRSSKVLLAPPVLHCVSALAAGLDQHTAERLLAVPQAHGEPPRRLEFRPGFICFPVRSPTKPPATHTNCYLVGGREFIVIDPASPDDDEQTALSDCIDDLKREGRVLREIVLTHLHPDHIGGVEALRKHLGGDVTVAAHKLTADALSAQIRVDRLIADGDRLEFAAGFDRPAISLLAMHTPGHARGHLCFWEASSGTLIAGDNVVGVGSVLIDPPEGNMRDYLNSLARMRALKGLSVLLGAHGPAVGNPQEKIDEYITHRLEREANILAAVRAGEQQPEAIVTRVYTDVPEFALPWAQRAAVAHLEKLAEDGMVQLRAAGWTSTRPAVENS